MLLKRNSRKTITFHIYLPFLPPTRLRVNTVGQPAAQGMVVRVRAVAVAVVVVVAVMVMIYWRC